VRFLLDTNVISEVGKLRPHPKVLNWLLAHHGACAIPSIAVAERYQGAFGVPAPRREKLLADIQAFVDDAGDRMLSFDLAAAKSWGEYVASPPLRRNPQSYPDTQIAAIAISRGLTVVTRNTVDFPGVATLNPFED
jgi:predicted nucleic acid-binding protein